MKEEELAAVLKALAVPVRLRILRLIAERPLCVNAITGRLRISQPAVSQHLAVLRHAGLVRGQKSGYRVHYSLNEERLQQVREAVKEFPGDPPRARGARGRVARAAAATAPATSREGESA